MPVGWDIWRGVYEYEEKPRPEPTMQPTDLIAWLNGIANVSAVDDPPAPEPEPEPELSGKIKKRKVSPWTIYQKERAEFGTYDDRWGSWWLEMQLLRIQMENFRESDPYGHDRWVQGLEDDRILEYWEKLYDYNPHPYVPVFYTLEALLRGYMPIMESIGAGDYDYAIGMRYDEWLKAFRTPAPKPYIDYWLWKELNYGLSAPLPKEELRKKRRWIKDKIEEEIRLIRRRRKTTRKRTLVMWPASSRVRQDPIEKKKKKTKKGWGQKWGRQGKWGKWK